MHPKSTQMIKKVKWGGHFKLVGDMGHNSKSFYGRLEISRGYKNN